jgi:hypothetical protein
MTNRNLSRRLEKLEARMLPPATRHVIRVVYVNTDGTVAPGGFTVDPWARREQERKDKAAMSPTNRFR